MDRIYRQVSAQINNVGLGQAFNVGLPIGPAYRYIDVFVTATPAAGLTMSALTDFLDLCTLTVNSKAARTFLATEADSIYTRFGSVYKAQIYRSSGSGNTLTPILTGTALATPTAATQTTCKFRIYFEEPWRKEWAAAASRKFPTSWPSKTAGGPSQVLSDFSLQFNIPNTTANAAATGLSVLVYAGTDSSQGILDKNGNPITNTLKWYRNPGVSYTAAGDQPLNNLVKYDKGKVLTILEQMTIFSQSTGDDVQRLVIAADGRTVFDATAPGAMGDLINHGFNPLWNLDQFEYVADANDIVMDGLVLSTPNGAYVNTLTATATLSAAAGGNKTLVVISQVYGPLD